MGRNIYADKSSLVLNWILMQGVEKEDFSLREVAVATGIGLGTVHRVFEHLILKGYLQAIGIRTNKKFAVKKASELLFEWIGKYNIVEKCKFYSYSSGFISREQIIEALILSGLQEKVVLALHSSAEAQRLKNTNLQQLELYMVEPGVRQKLERTLKLSPKERGYEVLLIEPYYKAFLKQSVSLQVIDSENYLFHTSELLTFLDLYHFPLRGIEQAEFMAHKNSKLKRIYKRGTKNG